MEVDVEKIIQSEIAAKIIENMNPEDIQKIMEASLAKTLKEVLSPWKVESAIKDKVQIYLEEYLAQSEVQDRIRIETWRCADELIGGVVAVAMSRGQEAIKSNYSKFVKDISYDSVLAAMRAKRKME